MATLLGSFGAKKVELETSVGILFA